MLPSRLGTAWRTAAPKKGRTSAGTSPARQTLMNLVTAASVASFRPLALGPSAALRCDGFIESAPGADPVLMELTAFITSDWLTLTCAESVNCAAGGSEVGCSASILARFSAEGEARPAEVRASAALESSPSAAYLAARLLFMSSISSSDNWRLLLSEVRAILVSCMASSHSSRCSPLRHLESRLLICWTRERSPSVRRLRLSGRKDGKMQKVTMKRHFQRPRSLGSLANLSARLPSTRDHSVATGAGTYVMVGLKVWRITAMSGRLSAGGTCVSTSSWLGP